MDVKYINPFISALHNTFSTMLQKKIQTLQPRLKVHPYPSYDITGVIGLSGEATGFIAICFPESVAFKVASAMIGEEIKTLNNGVTDAIGELANIVAGNAKKELTDFSLSISLPNVIIGTDHKISTQSGIPVILVPFNSDFGEFAMEVALKTK